MLTEKQIDQIAESVCKKYSAKVIGNTAVHDMSRKHIEIASKVVADMLKEYQKALQEQASSETH